MAYELRRACSLQIAASEGLQWTLKCYGTQEYSGCRPEICGAASKSNSKPMFLAEGAQTQNAAGAPGASITGAQTQNAAGAPGASITGAQTQNAAGA